MGDRNITSNVTGNVIDNLINVMTENQVVQRRDNRGLQ